VPETKVGSIRCHWDFNHALGGGQMMDLPAVSVRLAGLPKATTRA